MNKRMGQLTAMFSSITGTSLEDALEIILQTETGKAVMENNMAVMYEQQTENLYEIAEELNGQEEYADIAELLSLERIVSSMNTMEDREKSKKRQGTLLIPKKPELRCKDRGVLAAKRKNILQVKKQNQINEGRVKYADTTERQK